MPETAEAPAQSAGSSAHSANAAAVEKRSFVAQHPLKFIVFLIVLAAAAIGGYRFWLYLGSYESTDDAQIDGDIYAITSRISGTVKSVGVQDNQLAKSGQLLVELDPTDYQLAVDQARAAVTESRSQIAIARPAVPITSVTTESTISNSASDIAGARAAIAAAQRTYDAAQREVDAAQADIRRAEADAAKAQADLVRYKQLVDKDEISRQQYDQAEASARAAIAGVESKKALAESRKAAAESAARVIEEAQARLTQAQNRQAEAQRNRPQEIAVQNAIVTGREATAAHQQTLLESALQNLSYAKILAPVDGIVGKKNVEPGQQVSAGQQLMAVVSISNLWVTANFKETQLKAMHPGQRATIHVDAYDKDFDGEVESVAGASGARFSLLPPENATGNYVKVVQRVPVRIRIKDGQDPNHLLRPGMSVEPQVWLDSK